MSMHRGAEILGGVAAAGLSSLQPTPVSSPNTPAPTNTPLQKVQATAGSDPINTAYSLVVATSNSLSDTFTTALTASGRWIVSDGAGNVISYPT